MAIPKWAMWGTFIMVTLIVFFAFSMIILAMFFE